MGHTVFYPIFLQKYFRGENMEKREKNKPTPSSKNFNEKSETAFDLVNKYGTYEIQPTAATENAFPKIAQGLPKKENRKNSEE